MDTTFIYFLQDPTNPVKGYVGKSDNPRKRFIAHLRPDGDYYAARWIKSLLARGLKPSLKIIDEIPWEYRKQLEIAYIELFRESGFILTNSTAGGEGMHNPSEETRAKMSAARTGLVRTPEHCANLSAALMGHVVSPETCAKISAGVAGEKHPQFGKTGEQSHMFGRTLPPETCAKISAATSGEKNPNYGNKRSPEECAKFRKKLPGASSQFFGVSWRAAINKWQANFSTWGKKIYLGCFLEELDAAKAYDSYAREHCGAHAVLNFPD